MDMETRPDARSNPSAGTPRAPESDVREISRHHGQTCTVLAGFAFTTIILFIQEAQGPAGQSSLVLRNRVTASFLVGFVGCLVAAFNFAVVASDLKLSVRPRGTFFLSSIAATLSGIHLLTGTNYLMTAYLPDLTYLSKWIMIVLSLFLMLSMVNVEIGIARFYDPAPYSRRQRMLLAVPSLTIHAIASILSLTHAIPADRLAAVAFPVVVACSLLFIAVGSAWALVVHSREEDYRLPSRVTVGWILVMTLLLALIILMT